jgi:predicted  nucleic acid-binding Zn-ribbon protein
VARRSDSFTLERFEYLPAGADLALLRLTGRWAAPADGHPDCSLLLMAGERREWLDAVPQPGTQSGGPWRAAYSAPLDLVEAPGTRFLLVPPDGHRVALSPPAPHAAAPREPDAPPRRGFTGWVESRRRLQRDLAAAEQATADERARAERELAALGDKLTTASRERARLVARFERHAEHRRQLQDELTIRVGEAEQATAALDGARGAARAARAEATRLRGRVATLEGLVDGLRRGAEEGDERLAEIERHAHALRAALDRLTTAREPDGHRLAELRDAVDRDLARLASLEHQAVALRGSIHAGTGVQHDSGLDERRQLSLAELAELSDAAPGEKQPV